MLAPGPSSLPSGRGVPFDDGWTNAGQSGSVQSQGAARTKTGKTLSQPLFLGLSFLSPLDPPPVSQWHTFCELFYCLSLKRLIYTFVRKIPELFPLNAMKLPFNEAFGRPPSHLKSKVSHWRIVTNKDLHWSHGFTFSWQLINLLQEPINPWLMRNRLEGRSFCLGPFSFGMLLTLGPREYCVLLFGYTVRVFWCL